MKNLLIKTVGFTIVACVSLMASGPRVTAALLGDAHNNIVAIETSPLVSNVHPQGGMMFEILTAALKSQNESATLSTYPVKKMVNYYLTQENGIGAFTVAQSVLAVNKKGLIVLPVTLIDEQYIYYKPAHPQGISWSGKLSNLKGLNFGEHEGGDTKAYKDAGINVVESRSRPLFQKLKEGKVDFIGVSALEAQEVINTAFASEKASFAAMQPTPADSVGLIVFNLKNPDAQALANKFRTGLSTLLKNGQYQAIVEKYYGKSPRTLQQVDKFKILWAKSSK